MKLSRRLLFLLPSKCLSTCAPAQPKASQPTASSMPARRSIGLMKLDCQGCEREMPWAEIAPRVEDMAGEFHNSDGLTVPFQSKMFFQMLYDEFLATGYVKKREPWEIH